MTIKILGQRIDYVAKVNQIPAHEVINELLSCLKDKYNSHGHTEEEVKIIGSIKSKIIKFLTESDNQKKVISHSIKYGEIFNLDPKELPLVNFAWGELEAAGDVYSLNHELGLTKQGVVRYQ